VREQFQDDTGGQGSIRDWLADKLLLKLDVRPSRESNVIGINYHAADAQFAATLANAFAEAYIQVALELKMDPSRRQATWFDEQVKALRIALEKTQKRLSDFQRDKGIAGADARLDVENARLAEISNQLVAAQGATYDSTARVRQLNQVSGQKRLQELPDIIGNTLLQSMKADLVRAQGKLAITAQRYDRNHPEYQNAAAEVAALENKLSVEIDTAKGAIGEAAKLATQREEELRQAVERQKARILELKQARDEQDVLAREVDNSQHAYDAAVQRTSQVRLESRLDQSNIAVLNAAVPPLLPTWPKIFLNLILALLLGTLFGIGAALLAELRDRRVRTRTDVGDVPVLAEILLPIAPAIAA
jgi:polysaccharide biosynthesis transport protein